jgi:hypothetical protein
MDSKVISQMLVTGSLVSLVAIWGCSSDKTGARELDSGMADAGSLDAGTARIPAYQAWEEIREAVRLSPDHLAARAKDVVASADAVAIFKLVRDAVVTLPPNLRNDRDVLEGARWGTVETLRSGAGTPREKVDLLVELYRAAGFEADAVEIPAATDIDYRQVYWGGTTPVMGLPTVDSARLSRWRSLLADLHPVPALPTLDADGQQRAAVADPIAVAGLPLSKSQAFNLQTPQTIPVARVVVDGVPKAANPMLRDAVLTDLPQGKLLAPIVLPRVKVTLSARNREGQDVVLVEKDWPSDLLAGRQLGVVFQSDLPTTNHLLASFVEPRTFTSGFVLQNKWQTDKPFQETVAGLSFTERGETVQWAGDGTVSIDGRVAGTTARSVAKEATVASLGASASARNYPGIELQVSAADARGVAVTGLGAASFEVLENGKPVSARLYRNAPPPPRVLLLVDGSNSIPAEFHGDSIVSLGREIATRISASAPLAQYRAAMVGYVVKPRGPWTSDITELETQLRGMVDGDSTLWTSLGDAVDFGPNVIVLITDGATQDDLTDKIRLKLAGNIPVVVLFAGTPDATMPAMATEAATLSGGVATAVASQEQAVQTLLGYLARFDLPPYLLSYTSTATAATSATVEVRIRDTAITTTTTYTVPASPIAAGGFTGLYLTVSQNGLSATRTLAGIARHESRTEPTAAELDDILGQLFGSAVLSFEGWGPTTGRWLDEVLTARLSQEPLTTAARAHNSKELLSALERGTLAWLPEHDLIQARLPAAATAQSITYPDALRVVLTNRRIRFGQGFSETIDILPVSTWATLAVDAATGWSSTLNRTVALALAEQAALPTSTLSLMDHGPLVAHSFDGAVAAIRASKLSSTAIDQWVASIRPLQDTHLFVFPDTAEIKAMWAVNARTGAVLGLLSDGSGGAAVTWADATASVDRDKNLASAAQAAASLLGVPIPALAGFTVSLIFVVQYEALLVSMLPPSSASDAEVAAAANALTDALEDLLADIPKTMAGEEWPTIGTILDLGDLEDAIEALVLANGT